MAKSPTAKREAPAVVAESTAHLNGTDPQTAPIVKAEQPRQTIALWEQQIDLVRDMCCKPRNRNATDAELALFLHQCRARKLDPLSRQIYCVFRKAKEGNNWVEKMTIQTSIDGFRLIAQRTGEYRGQAGPFWCDQDGEWRDVWTSQTPPAAAKVGVYREGFKDALWSVARFDSYAQWGTGEGGREYLTGQWGKMADLMIAKCAEALALRRAFPDELSGIYTSDEMAQADRGHDDDHPAPTKPQELPATQPTPQAPPKPAPAPAPSPAQPGNTKARLWGAISVWTGIPTSETGKLAEAGKRIYQHLKVPANATATEDDLKRVLAFVTKQQGEHKDFSEWVADRLEAEQADKALGGPRLEPTAEDDSIPF